MYSTRIPQVFRPGGRVRTPQLGIDLPTWFFEGLKGIDEDLFVLWHPYRLHWNDILNQYSGELEDPRLTISISPHYGDQELWGWVLTDGQKRPLSENRWHVWRLCRNYGWAHIFPILNTEEAHLKHYLHRLFLRTQIQDKYGIAGWQRFEKEEDELKQQKRVQDHENQFQDTMNENRSLMRVALENMERGYIQATNPTKEVIMSYPGQKKFDKIERPLTDKEGGFFAPGQD